MADVRHYRAHAQAAKMRLDKVIAAERTEQRSEHASAVEHHGRAADQAALDKIPRSNVRAIGEP